MKNWVTRILTVQQCDMKLRSLEVKYKTIPGKTMQPHREWNEKIYSITYVAVIALYII
jgi:hypothetical protein